MIRAVCAIRISIATICRSAPVVTGATIRLESAGWIRHRRAMTAGNARSTVAIRLQVAFSTRRGAAAMKTSSATTFLPAPEPKVVSIRPASAFRGGLLNVTTTGRVPPTGVTSPPAVLSIRPVVPAFPTTSATTDPSAPAGNSAIPSGDAAWPVPRWTAGTAVHAHGIHAIATPDASTNRPRAGAPTTATASCHTRTATPHPDDAGTWSAHHVPATPIAASRGTYVIASIPVWPASLTAPPAILSALSVMSAGMRASPGCACPLPVTASVSRRRR